MKVAAIQNGTAQEILSGNVLDLCEGNVLEAWEGGSGAEQRTYYRVENHTAVGLTVIRNEITYQLLADGFRVHTKLPSDS